MKKKAVKKKVVKKKVVKKKAVKKKAVRKKVVKKKAVKKKAVKRKAVKRKAVKKKPPAPAAKYIVATENGLESFKDFNEAMAAFARQDAATNITNRSPNLPPMEPGQCYKNAFDFVVCNRTSYKGIKVVHGYPQDRDGQVFGHAWVEWKQYCYDPNLDIQISGYEYYMRGNIDPSECRYYSPKEALKLMTTQKSCGPWEVVRPDAVFTETRVWAVRDRRRTKDGRTRSRIWNELAGLEIDLNASMSDELNELATELARAVVGDGDILVCHQADNREVRGFCIVGRGVYADDAQSEKPDYWYWVHENQFEFEPPLRIEDLLASGGSLTFPRKRRMVMAIERDEFAELVQAISAQSTKTAEDLQGWLGDAGYLL